jgi:hypothetical protein
MIRRCLKGVAVAMILLPEPVTTVLGIVMLTVLLALSRPKRLSDLGNLEELVNKSLKNKDLSEPCLYFLRNQNTIFHALKGSLPQHPTPVVTEAEDFKTLSGNTKKSYQVSEVRISSIEDSRVHKIEKNPAALQASNWFDNRKVSEKVLHHTLKTSLPQYEADADASDMRPGDYKEISADELQGYKLHTLANPAR